MSAKLTKWLLVLSAVLLSVLLYFAPKSKASPTKATASTQVGFESASIELYVNQALKALAPETKATLDVLEKNGLPDSLAVIWNQMRRPDIASYYAEKAAIKSNREEDWLKAGSRYYYAVQFCEDKTEIPLLYRCAMRCFNKTLTLNKNNSDAKILLASCYVEGTESPMDGISLLREVEKADSNNVKLQLAFASFSVKSGQLDKAIVRFNKVLRADSNYIEAYLHLADAYEQLGQSEKTVQMLEKYSAKTTDITARLEVDKYIKQLKTSINK